MKRSEGVNTDEEEKCLVGVKMILHILCSAERCMIRKSSSLSFTLAFFTFIFSFTHAPCPLFSRHHSEGVLLPHAGEWAHSKWLVMHINSHYQLSLQAETLEIPFHFSSLIDNPRSARRFRLEIMDLDAKLVCFFSSHFWLRLHGILRISLADGVLLSHHQPMIVYFYRLRKELTLEKRQYKLIYIC